MISRTYGWVQNPSDFKKLKLVVQIFDNKSKHYQKLKKHLVNDLIYFDTDRNNLQEKLNKNEDTFSYLELVGTSRDANGKKPKSRSLAIANSLIQITILPQSARTKGKKWTDNWTSDGYLRWAVSFNFVKHDRDSDLFSITEKGKLFSQSEDDSDTEKEILRNALLSYPPATQVLNILKNEGKPITKFTIGNSLGFIGEKGFTSYDEELMEDWLKSTTNNEDRKKIRTDIEGTSDKYARMISSWLSKVGFVKKINIPIKINNKDITGFTKFEITAKGIHALNKSEGSSKNKKQEKFFTWEFLAIDGKNKNYVRTRRAYILKFLQETNSFSKIITKLNQKGFDDDKKIIENDLIGLNNFGLRIDCDGNNVVLKDSICDFSIPDIPITNQLANEIIENKKIEFLNKTNLPLKYIELIEIAHDGQRNRDFEIITMELFRKIYKINSIHLGGSRKPDGLLFTPNYGIIVDTKAYSNGYSKNISQADEMIRYIEDNKRRDKNRNPTCWWEKFPNTIPSNQYYFLWISSNFISKFEEQLVYTAEQTKINGAALNVEQLLIGADKISKGNLTINDFIKYFKNEEIFF